MEEKQRWLLFFVISFTLAMVWSKYMAPPVQPSDPTTPTETVVQSSDAPTSATAFTAAQTPVIKASARGEGFTPAPPRQLRSDAPKVSLITDKYEIEFSLMGAVPVRWDVIDERFVPKPDPRDYVDGVAPPRREELITPELVDYPELPMPFETVLCEQGSRYLKEFNLWLYKAEPVERGGMKGYRFVSEANDSGVRMIKTYLIGQGDFSGRVEIEIQNSGEYNLNFDDDGMGLGVTMGPGLGFDPIDASMHRDAKVFGMGRYDMVSAVTKRHDDFVYKNVDKKTEEPIVTRGGQIDWSALISKYFVGALIPAGETKIAATRVRLERDLSNTIVGNEKHLKHFPLLEVYTPGFRLAPGESRTFQYDMFFGPKEHSLLKDAGHDLDRVLFYDSWGWMRYLCFLMMGLLAILHGVFGNWGVAILCLTVIVRLLLFPLVQKGLREQAKMSQATGRLKPLIDKVNEKYKNDPQRKQQEVMKIYKENGVNPLGMFKGCLWMMIQLPIFIALYKLLYQSVDLRGAPFLWVTDLSQPDRLFVFKASILGYSTFNLLPFITAATQMLSSKFSIQPSNDPQQQQMQKMMVYMMPVFILFITYGFPAGLMLYWLISNAWQIVQQIWVNKHIRKPAEAEAAAGGK